ncbi:MAG: VOC family protein [Dehalococcoidia bacterium]
MANPVFFFEVVGKDPDALRSFYSRLFDWEYSVPSGDPNYGIVPPAPGGIAGGVGSKEGAPGHVTFYVRVPDVAAHLAKANSLGGTTILPTMEVPAPGGAGGTLKIALFADPEGHMVGLSEDPGQ